MTRRNTAQALRTLLFTAVFYMSALAANAQTPQQWWGYWTSTMPLNAVGELATGSNEMGIRLTSQNAKAVGAKLHAVRFYISDKTSVAGAKVWASSRQAAGYNLLDQDVPTEGLLDVVHDGAPTTVVLDEPIDLVQAGNAYSSIYVGFTIDMPENRPFTPCEMMASGTATGQANANLYKWRTAEDACGPLAMQLLISNPAIPDAGATALIPDGLIVAKGSDVTVDIPIRNDGMQGLQSITFEWTMDETASWETQYVFENPVSELDAAPTIPVSITPPAEATWHQLGLNIIDVNGQACGSVAQPKPILVVEQYGTKRTVMEEFTGTWCPNCPRGTVGVHNLCGIFGDSFIPIAVHNDDPMTIADYDGSKFRRTITSALGGFPSASVDRTYNCDPYMGYELVYSFQTDQIVAEALTRKAVADIDVEAAWDNPSTTNINVRARTTFYYNSDDNSHALILVLTADGLTGDDSRWLQVNEFVGREGLPDDMDPYVNGERRMKETYDHVAVAVAGVENGIAGSIAAPLVSMQPQEYECQLSFPESLLQDGMQLHAVAMLVDTTTGQVVNAATKPVERGASGIATTQMNGAKQRSGWYTLDGRRLAAKPASRGVYVYNGRAVVVR